MLLMSPSMRRPMERISVIGTVFGMILMLGQRRWGLGMWWRLIILLVTSSVGMTMGKGLSGWREVGLVLIFVLFMGFYYDELVV